MSIGETLAAARQGAGLTVADVSAATRVRQTIVAGIERDDFGLCGGHFYARGHIRSIATSVGVDPEPLVRQYDEEHGGSPRDAGLSPTSEPEPVAPVSMAGGRRRPNWTMALATILVIVVAFGVFQLVTGSSGPAGAPNPGAASSPSASLSPQRAPASGSPAPAADPSRTRATVLLNATARTWVSASDAQGNQLYSDNLEAGESVRLTDKQAILLVIGNMGGVSLTVNGRELGVLGEPGEVLSQLRVYPDRVEGLPS